MSSPSGDDLAPGRVVGGLEILDVIGAGGMGVVYRARDARLGRDVAVKVLPQRYASDPGRLRRFEQEVRATCLVSHPNVVSVHGVGTDGGRPYVVTELLEGETLRERLRAGPVPVRKAVEVARQVASALAAAHEKGIVHRDLKPENVFVLPGGHVKVLDLGLARIVEPEPAGVDSQAATTGLTRPGTVLGTVGYMAPEQVRGQAADHRADVFALGVMLHELLAGAPPFRGESSVETMNAILKDEAPALGERRAEVPPVLEAIVRRCLEKRPEDRFQPARDLAFQLETVSSPSMASGVAHVTYRQVTFRRGNVLHARFAPDGQTVVYGAAFDGKPTEVFLTRIGSPESMPLGMPNADALAVSASGELAILRREGFAFTTAGHGTLVRVPLAGGAPRDVVGDVTEADWTPDGSLAVVRPVGDGHVVERPVGVRISGSTVPTPVRVSPDGAAVAHVVSPPAIRIAWRDGSTRRLPVGVGRIDGLAWSPDGSRVWYSGAWSHDAHALLSMDLDGRERCVATFGYHVIVHDVAADGRLLVEHEMDRNGLACVRPGAPGAQELSWFDAGTV